MAAVLVLAAASPAVADHNLIRIEQVMAGLAGDTTIQFIEMKMLADGNECQGTATDNLNRLIGHCAPSGPGSSLLFFDGAGAPTAEFRFTSNTAVGLTGRSILVATPRYTALRGVPAPDHIMPPLLVPGSGKVCYRSRPGTVFVVNQCLSYGTFSGDTEGFGRPAPALPVTGLVSLRRTGDESDNFQSFALGTPTPTNNATVTATIRPPTLVAATLPSSRSVQVTTAATAFVTVINTGTEAATGCAISPIDSLPAVFRFEATNARNEVIGLPNSPVSIEPGAAQTFVIAVTPLQAYGVTNLGLNFQCDNTDPAPSVPGLNTLLTSAAAGPIPDIVALAATLQSDGVVHIPGVRGPGAFAVATVNVGQAGAITVTADTGGVALPLALALCETVPATGVCSSGLGTSVTTHIAARATPTFAVFATASAPVSFEPARSRIFVRFRDGDGIERGATSVAGTTE